MNNDNRNGLCFRPSRWQRLLWREFSTEVADPDAVRNADKSDIASWGEWQTELFSRLYSEHVVEVPATERGADGAWAARAHAAAEQLPEWQQLCERVRGDQLWAGMAGLTVAQEVAGSLPAAPSPEAQQNLPRLRQRLEGLQQLSAQGLPLTQEIQAAQAEISDTEAAMNGFAAKIDETSLRQALRRAVAAANAQIDESEALASAFGYGDSEGAAGRSGTVAERAQLVKRIRDNRKLAKIAAEAGRLRRIAARKQREKAKHAPDEISDVEQGADLSRVLPSELARLRHPLTRRLFLRDYSEKRLMQYKLEGNEVQGRGPLVVLIDNSGSMGGAREVWSKAVALALLDIAVRQKRAFAVLHYSVRVEQETIFEAQDFDSAKLLNAMDFFSGGGTDLGQPADRALEIITRGGALKKADVVIISDGDLPSCPDLGGYRERARASHVTTYGVLIGGSSRDFQTLGTWCDSVVQAHDLAEDGVVHDRIFEI